MEHEAPAPACGFGCIILESADKVPFKSGTFCTNLNSGFRYDVYFFRSDAERDALERFCGKTCGEISSVVCGSDQAIGEDDAYKWSPLLFKSVYRDCCDGFDARCSYCPPSTELQYPDKQAVNTRTTFNATCAQFEAWFDLEWWAHISGETLDSYGRPSGNPTYSCSDLRYRDPIWSPIREWDSLYEDCPCIEPAPSWFPTQSAFPNQEPSHSPTASLLPSVSTGPSYLPSSLPSENPSASTSPTIAPTELECEPNPSETFASLGSLFTAVYVAGTYAYLFYFKSKKAGRPRWGIYEMVSEVVGQFIATVMGVGVIIICQTAEEYRYISSLGVIMSMTSLLAIDGFELIITLMTVPFMGPGDHPGESFDKARWNQLGGFTMWLARFLMWCIGSGLPLVILFLDDIHEEPMGIMIPCFISLGIGMLIGFFGPCVLRKPGYTGGGSRLLWQLIKQFVGVIPGLIVAIANKDWIALGWGAELFIEISHFLGEMDCG